MTAWLQDNIITLINGAAFGMLLYVLAVGLSILLGMLNMLNLAHGAMYLLGAYIAFSIMGDGGGILTFLLALVVAIVIGAAAGMILEFASRPLAGRGHMDEALLTLGIALAGGALLTEVFGATIKTVPAPTGLESTVNILGTSYPTYRLALIVMGVVIAVGIDFILERTTTGALIRAIVHDRDQVAILGVNVRLVVLCVFAASAALAVVAGVLGGPLLGASPGLDHHVLLLAMVVVVIGGLGSARGALVSALVIGMAQNIGVSVSAAVAPFLIFGTMLAVLIFRPHGLLGRAAVGGR